jgi:hypothetical protein
MATRTVSLSFEKRSSKERNEIRVRLLVLDENSGDVVTDLVLSPEQYTALCSSQVIRVEER